MQTTNTLLMIEPVAFCMNEQTKVNNYFQKEQGRVLVKTTQTKALKEFNAMVTKLQKAKINVIVVKDTVSPKTPDAIFPNNWISFHKDKLACVYPMFAENRRLERREDIFKVIENDGFKIENILDYTSAENENLFLEGTGSMVLDRVNKIAYCAISPRSSENIFIEFCEDLEYTPIVFRANQKVDGKSKPIYHTNVMMSIGKKFALICLQTITDKNQKKQIVETLSNSDKEIITISEEQLNNFAGNILQVTSTTNKDYIVISKTAFKSLRKAQITLLEKHGELLVINVSTIEQYGGGSVRCMLAEIFN